MVNKFPPVKSRNSLALLAAAGTPRISNIIVCSILFISNLELLLPMGFQLLFCCHFHCPFSLNNFQMLLYLDVLLYMAGL